MPEQSAPTASAFEEFRRRVLNDQELLQRLRATEGTPEFIRACVEEARRLRITLTPAAVESALQAARRETMEGWMK